MQDIIQRVKTSGKLPTRQDIADLLAVVAPPGRQRQDKYVAVENLFLALEHRPENFQGHSVLDELESWEEF